jgi:hypothetical protein
MPRPSMAVGGIKRAVAEWLDRNLGVRRPASTHELRLLPPCRLPLVPGLPWLGNRRHRA